MILDIANAQYTGEAPLPYGLYRLHVKQASFGPSKSSGSPMITLVCEVISPEEILTPEEKTYRIAGLEVIYYFVITESQSGKVRKAFEKLGVLSVLGRIDTDSPETPIAVAQAFDKLTFSAILFAVEDVKRLLPTLAQRAARQPGSPILDDDGKPVKLGWDIKANMDDILGKPEFVQF